MTHRDRLHEEYHAALQGFVLARGEGQLRIAYELGRRAIREERSVLDLVELHHEALLAALTPAGDAQRVHGIIGAAGDFLREALSAFEMLQRGFRDVRDGAAAGRHHATMVRRLSDLLADGSVELGASGSLEEMALLLAEQALELCGADACLVTFGDTGTAHVTGVAYDEERPRWPVLLTTAATGELADAVPVGARSLRRAVGEPAGADVPIAHHLPGVREWLVAPLRSLAGAQIGSIQVFSGSAHVLGDEEEQVAVHLAQMAAAALERRGWPPPR